MWTAGAVAIDLDATWPTPIISTIVRAFSKPGGQVVLLPWPTTQPTPHQTPDAPHHVGADRLHRHAPRATTSHSVINADAELVDALAAVEYLDRIGRVAHVAADADLTGPVSRPFWADLLGDPDRAPLTASPSSPQPSSSGVDATVLDGPDAVSPDSVNSTGNSPVNSADLIITSLRPEHSGNQSSDLVALVAARLLRIGGILIVLTHCDWSMGELTDPTGAVVTAAQNADLLYLQHIVALHAPVRGGRLVTEPLTGTDDLADGVATEAQARAAHHAAVRGLPAPHRRVHSDVLVFSQPHEHDGPLPEHSAEQAITAGVIR